MRKILALCLVFILVVSMSLTSLAATITVPAATMVSGEFANLTALPDGWTIEGVKDTNYKFDATGITPAALNKDYGYVQIYKKDAFDAGKANYTFSVSFSHYDGTQYFHFGAETTADAMKNGVSDTGYTLTATHYNTTASEGTFNYVGQYALYKEGEKIADLTDAGAVWAYQGVREFKFYVTEEGITASGAVTEKQIADTEPIKSGYVGAYMVNNSKLSVTTALVSMKLTTAEYSYDVAVDETDTGAYVVLGTEYEESHTGTLYYNQSLAGLSEGNAPAGVTMPTSNITYQTDYVQLTKFKPATVDFGTRTVDEGSWVVEAKYSATNESNKVQFYFLGYQLRSGKNDGGFKLYQDSTLLDSKDTSAFDTWGNGSLNVVKVMFDAETSTMDVYVDSTLVFENVAVENPTYTGTFSIYNNHSGKTYIYYVKIYTPDYADTSSYVEKTRSNFLFARDFSVNDATMAELNAQGFTVTGTGIDETGIYKDLGQASAEYTGHSFKGAYTLETRATGSYRNPETIVFNKTADGDYYCLAAKGAVDSTGISWNFYKIQGGTTTVLANNTTTEADDDKAFYANPRITKISLIPATDESGTLDIKIVLNGTEIVTATDTNPITKSGTFKVTTGYNKPSNLDYIKVYPNGTNPVYTAQFVVDGTETAEFVKGNTLFTFPTAMIGQTPAIVAALYEDNAMTDVKIIDIDALNVGVAELFDTTKSTATNASIKVFMWNSIEGMAPVLEPFVLE